jgi:hypothetical protein
MTDLDQLAAALVSAQAEFAAIPKTADNPFFKSKYAPLSTVVEVTQPILAKHGLAVSQHPVVLDGESALTTYLLHSSGQQLVSTMRLCAAKNDPQGQGAAITYARRFAFMAVLGLVADDDDDGNTATTRARQAPPPSKKLPTHIAKLAAVAKQHGLDTKKLGQRFLDDYGVAVTDADPKTVEAFTQLVADEAAIDEAAGNG